MPRPLLGRVTVVMVTYFSGEHVDAALGGLPLDRLAGVVAVDNHSGDDTLERLAGWVDRGVQVLARPDNTGFGAGCNTGMEVAGSELVLLLNPDARIAAADLQLLVRYLDDHPLCAVAAPRLFRDGVALSSSGDRAGVWTELRFSLPTRLVDWLPERRHAPGRAQTGPVGMVEGACLLVRRDAFQEVGGFDEAYFLFFEELDLAERLRRAGRTVDLVATASATHMTGASRAQRPWAARDDYYASTVRYLWHWRGRRPAQAYAALSRLSWWLLARRGGLPSAEARAYSAAVKGALGRLGSERT